MIWGNMLRRLELDREAWSDSVAWSALRLRARYDAPEAAWFDRCLDNFERAEWRANAFIHRTKEVVDASGAA